MHKNDNDTKPRTIINAREEIDMLNVTDSNGELEKKYKNKNQDE